MNLNFTKITGIFSKKLVLQLYFIFFILINVLDFFNYLSGDVDFFKKILSWILIGYVFYRASFSKIFVGVCDRFFDWMFLLGFCLMGIMKSIFHYIQLSGDLSSTFPIFHWILMFVPKTSNPFLQYSFVIGVFIVIVSSIFLIKKHKPTKRSLIGSFNLKGYFKFIGGEYIILSIVAVFFGSIVFNFIMEWFALAVDSIILVLGLFYYIFMFLHRHTSIEVSGFLSSVSNTGNNFFVSLIEKFSNKKSFMIGVSFILTLHLLVDIGVYLIPFVSGLTNTLYGGLFIDLIPSFNILDYTNSQFYIDLGLINFEIIGSISLFIIHFFTIVLFLIFMVAPFYYFYQNVLGKKISLPNWAEFLFVVSLMISLFVLLMPSLQSPITIGVPNLDLQISGVDLNTQSVINVESTSLEHLPVELLLVLILFLIILVETRVLFKSNINIFIRRKIIPSFVLVFFVGYITIFGYTTIANEVNSSIFKDDIRSSSDEYYAIMNLYEESLDDNIFKRMYTNQYVKVSNFDMNYIPFSTFNPRNLSEEKIDFLIITLTNIDESQKYEIPNHNSIAVFNGDYSDVNSYFESGNFTFIYKLGEDVFTMTGINEREYRITNFNPNFEKKIILLEQSKLTSFVELYRLIILLIFYIFGLFAFSTHFIKTNIIKS